MDNENTQLSNIDVGKLNFQPMPKRFMVWDKEKGNWLSSFDDDGRKYNIFDISELDWVLDEYGYNYDDVIICQSTNLIDKNGKEIFEGSILREPDDSISVVQYDGDEGMYRTKCENVLDDMVCGGEYFEVIGHILSNPELVEENK